MASNIDATKPVFGNPTTQSVRDNFQAAHDEITALQSIVAPAPFLPTAGGTMLGPIVLAANASANLHPVSLQQLTVTLGSYAPTSSIPVAASTTSPMNGTAAVGTGTNFARVDHVHPSDTSRLSTTGGNLSGTISGPQASFANMNVNGAAGNERFIAGMTAGVTRWVVDFADQTAESGNSAGSNFAINRFGDSGAFAGQPLIINRASGAIAITSAAGVDSLTCNGSARINGGVNISTGTSNSLVTSGPYVCQSGGITAQGSNGLIYALGGVVGVRASAGNPNPSLSLESSTPTNVASLRYDMPSAYIMLSNSVGGGFAKIQSDAVFAINGVPYCPAGGPWAASSDARIKNVIGDFTRGLDDVLKLRPVVYTYKGNDTPTDAVHETQDNTLDESKLTGAAPYAASPHYYVAAARKEFVGFVAQELEAVFPDMVTQRSGFIDGEAVADIRDVNTGPLLYALVNAVRELCSRVSALETRAA